MWQRVAGNAGNGCCGGRAVSVPHLFGELLLVHTGGSVEPFGSKLPPLDMAATHIIIIGRQTVFWKRFCGLLA